MTRLWEQWTWTQVDSVLFWLLLQVATGGTQVDDVCFDSCYKSLPVAVVAFVFLSATGRYRWIQAVVSAFPLLLAGCLHANDCFVFINLL